MVRHRAAPYRRGDARDPDDVLVTEDWTPLEPKVLEHKYDARRIG
jgi:hypothetical protein